MLRHLVGSAVLLLMSGHTLIAAENNTNADEWLRFFVGSWKRTSTVHMDGQETKNTSEWSSKLAAGGTTDLTTGKTSEGDELTYRGHEPYPCL